MNSVVIPVPQPCGKLPPPPAAGFASLGPKRSIHIKRSKIIPRLRLFSSQLRQIAPTPADFPLPMPLKKIETMLEEQTQQFFKSC